MGNILEIMEKANRILSNMSMEKAYIYQNKLFIMNTCIYTEGEIVSLEFQLRRIESAIIETSMGALADSLNAERNREINELSLED